jgi:integrase
MASPRAGKSDNAAWPLAAFGRHLGTGASEGTVRLRVSHLRRFSRWHPDPWRVDRRAVERYIAGLRAPEYQKSVLASLHIFYAWALEEELAGGDPSRGVRGQRVEPREGRPCDPGLLERALRAADADTALMLRIGSETGLRRAEIARLHTRDVTPDGRWLVIVGKGSKQRRVPLSDDLRREILARPAGWVFPGRRNGGPITPGAAGRKIRRALGDKPHSLRHRAATDAYDHSGDIVLVQRVLGHASVATTQRYLGRADARDADNWDAAIRAAKAGRLLPVVDDDQAGAGE